MDVTPQVINEVEFHQKMRGYDPDEVDDFLERVAVAVGQLHDRVAGADERVAAAERRAAELERRLRDAQSHPVASTEEETETIRRTLVLAQRTADAAVKEAKEQAKALIDEAQANAQRMVEQAEADARRASEETRQRLIAEIAALEETRDALLADQGILERHLEEQRLRLRSAIGDLQRLLDDPARLRVAPAPEISGATRPAFVEEPAVETEPAANTPAGDDGTVIDLEAEAGARAESSTDQRDDMSRPVTGGVRFTPAEEPLTPAPSAVGANVAVATDDDRDDEGAWSRFVRQEMVDRPTEAVDFRSADDAYLSELRRAMLEDTSAGGPEPGEQRARPRFGRRR